MKNRISKTDSLICVWYAKLGNIREAAIQAGFSPDEAVIIGTKVLMRNECQEFVKKIRSAFSQSTSESVLIGLERLAFGSNNDAVKLVFSETFSSDEMIDKLDLFSVSEIKRDKNGGVEIKFFDRQKAMDGILSYSKKQDCSSAAEQLLGALSGAGNNDV
ncbi:MAG: terminase small subunit [Ruminococcus sp.]|nr:terminase small subunit [Ruminococcus sp.]